MDLKKAAAGVMVAAGIAGGGTVLTDQAINPYTDVGSTLDIAKVSSIQHGGTDTTILDKSKPAMTMQRWNGDEQMTVSYAGVSAAGSRAFLSTQMQWKGTGQQVNAYPIEATSSMEDGGMEFEVQLASKPASNQFPFTIAGAADMEFFYQPALTPEQPGETCTDTTCTNKGGDISRYRPENVVGSYAVYSSTKRDYHPGQPNYGAGKLFQIFRPKATDAAGNWTYADLSYAAGTLTVSVPQKFLDTATYPVVVDPTFGYTTTGASTFLLGGGSTSTFVDSQATLSGSAIASSISAVQDAAANGPGAKFMQYTINDNDAVNNQPGTYVSVPVGFIPGAQSVSLATTYTTITAPITANLVAGTYWIGTVPQEDGPFGSISVNNAYDTGTGRTMQFSEGPGGNQPTMFPPGGLQCVSIAGCGFATEIMTIYVNYTATDFSPVLSAASVSPGVALFSTSPTFTFSATWSDADSSGVHTFVCKGPTASTGGCDGAGTWASYTATFDATNPKTLTYASSDAPGIYQAYIFVCDASTCSNVIQTYFVIRPLTSNVIQMNGISSQKGGKIIQP